MNIISGGNLSKFDQTQYSTTQKNMNNHAAFSQSLQDALTAKPKNIDPNLVMPISLNTNFEEITEQAQQYYRQALDAAREHVDTSLDMRNQELQLYRETVIEIMDMPIEVEIEPHEVNEALLFGSLGIDFLEYKEMGVRIEMLNLTEQDVNSSEALQISDKEKLKELIDEQRSKLESQREELLAGTFIKEKTDHKAVIEQHFSELKFDQY
ncbi:hypothetical protein [Pseudoalteromonas luteoviolacea]|uniref:hypothetical protein n=1 Tax=Pseudoalteromonas luteoviolacea TaxID=43657 RepID=UPI001150B14D|nr:hypothetical protein [Pseudoalteromonas luteoviolacea]TQF67703.1 hypothetical protein FLM44_21220 [Pseudoalteromonas luteoviolacea]